MRQLRPISYRILRYLINGVLSLAIASGRQQECKALKNEASNEFFEAHMKQDFGFICKLIDRSPEDTWILLISNLTLLLTLTLTLTLTLMEGYVDSIESSGA